MRINHIIPGCLLMILAACSSPKPSDQDGTDLWFANSRPYEEVLASVDTKVDNALAKEEFHIYDEAGKRIVAGGSEAGVRYGVYALQRAFLIDWYFVDRTLITKRTYYPPQLTGQGNECLAQIVTSDPLSAYPEIMQGMVRSILAARRYIYIETPYFLPNDPVLFALKTAAVGGVDVRIICPLHSDARFTEWASRSYLRELYKAGARIYLYKTGFLHSKLLVCDDSLSSCGSTNVDFRSFENNFEANVFVYDSNIVARMKAIIERDMERSQLIDAKSYRSRIRVRLFESIVRLFSPLL